MSGLLVASHNNKVKEVSLRNSAAAAAAAGTTFRAPTPAAVNRSLLESRYWWRMAPSSVLRC